MSPDYNLFSSNIAGIFPSTGKLYNELSFSQLERREPFTLHVIATDGGAQPRSAECTVRINIIDENDNIPIFAQNVFDMVVQEDALAGREVSILVDLKEKYNTIHLSLYCRS